MANIETDTQIGVVGVEIAEEPEQLTGVEAYSDWANRVAEEAATRAAEAEVLATQARFADLIARSMDGESSIRFGYVKLEDDRPKAVQGAHTLTEMGDPGKLSFHYPEVPHQLSFLGAGWEHDHPRRGNIFMIDLNEVDALEVHPEGHVLFNTTQNDESFVYFLTDEPFSSATAVEVAEAMRVASEDSTEVV